LSRIPQRDELVGFVKAIFRLGIELHAPVAQLDGDDTSVVHNCPARDISCTSRYPTVVTVIVVM
jgi:hypothetical protein